MTAVAGGIQGGEDDHDDILITDVRYGDRLTQIRREVFGDNFPGSALITITALAVPEAKIEIQGYALVKGK